MLNFIWWTCFIFFAIIGQQIFPEIDFLIIGFVIVLHEQNLKQLCILTPILFILQESSATFVFGGVLLWYIAAFALTLISRWLFDTRNFMYILLFSSVLSIVQLVILRFMAALQGIYIFDSEHMIELKVVQGFVMAIIWYALTFIRPKQEQTPYL